MATSQQDAWTGLADWLGAHGGKYASPVSLCVCVCVCVRLACSRDVVCVTMVLRHFPLLIGWPRGQHGADYL